MRLPAGSRILPRRVDHKRDRPAIVDEDNVIDQGHNYDARSRCRRPTARRRTSGEAADLAAVYRTGSVALVKHPAASSSSSQHALEEDLGNVAAQQPFPILGEDGDVTDRVIHAQANEPAEEEIYSSCSMSSRSLRIE